MEVSKMNAKDLHKLKFIRKSEMEPTVRHHLKHAASQMGKQLDMWFKEQTFTIGTISKQQDKVAQSRKRLKKEQRRIKKREYARQQEEVRSKLHAIRLRIMLRKAVQKFRMNVVKAREYRNAELDKMRPLLHRPVNDIVTGSERSSNGDDGSNVSQGQGHVFIGYHRYLSSRGRTMDPIPEEDIELELDDIAGNNDINNNNNNDKTVKPVLSDHSKRRPKIGVQYRLSLNAGQMYCRMLQESILQYFRPSLSYHLSLRPLFCLFFSGRLRQVLL